jgi:membrane protein required for colicin V production
MQTALHHAQIGLSGMNPLDWVIALTLVVSTVTAFMSGLVRSLFSLAGLLLGVLIAAWYSPRAAEYIRGDINPFALARAVSFVVILVLVWVAAALLGRLLRGAFKAVGLGFLDRLGGAAFGFVRGAFLLAATLLPFGAFLQHFEAARTSVLMPYLLQASHGISFVMPRDFGKHLPLGDWVRSVQWRRDEKTAFGWNAKAGNVR